MIADSTAARGLTSPARWTAKASTKSGELLKVKTDNPKPEGARGRPRACDWQGNQEEEKR